MLQTLQVVGDGADRGGDDGLVQGGEEHTGHQAQEDRDDLAVTEGAVGGLIERLGDEFLGVVVVR